jgi:phage repressor protein C with HTH and peptisase S24 domain
MAVEESQVYRDLMRLKPDDLSPNAWALRAGVSRTVWSDMRRHGNPSRRTLEKLLVAAGSSLAEFEALRISPGSRPGAQAAGSVLGDSRASDWRDAPLTPIPVFATSMAGEWGDAVERIEQTELDRRNVLERLARPVSLANDPEAYGLTIVGDSMWPRFRPGRRVAVSPKAPVSVGDDVVLYLMSESAEADVKALVLVKELVRRTGSYVELRQFNPDATFRVPEESVGAIHKVAGELF